MTMGGGLGSKFPVWCRVLRHSTRAVSHIVCLLQMWIFAKEVVETLTSVPIMRVTQKTL